MCNEFKAETEVAEQLELAFPSREHIRLDDRAEYKTHIFPKYPAKIVRLDGERTVEDVKAWGFPSPVNPKVPVTNIRNLTSPFWRNRLAKVEGRCLVPFSEFCEWEGATKGQKVRRWFRVNDEPTAMFAGVWRGDVFAFLTCEPNSIVAPIHPKAMPVLLLKEDYDKWLTADWEVAKALVAPFPSQLMSVA